MSLWLYLLLITLAILLLFGLALLLPLRILGYYLRENKTDHFSLQLKLGLFGLCYEQQKNAVGEKELIRYLFLERLWPEGFCHTVVWTEQKEAPWWKRYLDRGGGAGFLKGGRRIRLILKKMTWSHFDLELFWGWSDPVDLALATGLAWALGGTMIGLLHHYFSLITRPQFNVVPVWNSTGLRLKWEGEVSLSIGYGLKLWRMVKKGGMTDGSSSH